MPPGDPALPTPSDTDLADLTARFAASSGPGLSAELSAELALEIVLHEIVEQACLATGATGAAIVLERDGEMVCRATSGPTAPQLGARMDAESGLSGECMRTRRVLRCDDAMTDPRADVEASARLGVRSVIVFPLVRSHRGEDPRDVTTLGILEAFSSRPAAFGDRDEHTLEALAGSVLQTLERAAELPAQVQENSAALPESATDPQLELASVAPSRSGWDLSGLDIVTRALGVVVMGLAVWLGVRVFQHLSSKQSLPAKATSTKVLATDSGRTNGAASGSHAGSPVVPAPTSPASKPAAPAANLARARETSSPPEGSLLVFENGKEVFRMPPSSGSAETPDTAQGNGLERAASVQPERVVDVAPDVAEGSLIHRVEPEYPEQARQQQIQGAVVLEARIGPDGAVQELKLVSGPPLLAEAAIAAVKQWRFRPRQAHGAPAEMQTTVTLNFRLPR